MKFACVPGGGRGIFSRNGDWGKECGEAEMSEEKRLFTEWCPGIQ